MARRHDFQRENEYVTQDRARSVSAAMRSQRSGGSKTEKGIRMSSLTHDEDGVPIKWLSPVKGGLSKQDQEDMLEICDMLEDKKKYQKAANLIYYCVAADSNNEALRCRWDRLVNKTNEERREHLKIRKEQELAERKAPPKEKASPSDTQIWRQLKQKGRLPEDTPNWHLNKLKPWKVPDAMALGAKHKRNAMSMNDPFQKILELEEACKMFNKVLEINPDHQEARSALNSCVTEMNNNYTRVKKIKHKVRALNPDEPMSMVGDFLGSKNLWVQEARKGP